MIETSECGTCLGKTYDTGTSWSYLNIYDNNDISKIKYGSAEITGHQAWDDVYFNSELTFGIRKFSMFMITDQVGLVTSYSL